MGSLFNAIAKKAIGQAILWTIILWSDQTLSDNFLSIEYSKKNQIRTGMIWIKFKPKLILSEKGRKRKKDSFRNKDSGQQAKPVSEDLMKDTLPYSAIGKLFFTTGYGQVGSCSAAFVGGGSIVTTAAHCVMTSTGDWNTDFIFVRSYGSADQEVYAIQCVAVPEKWGEVIGDSVLNHDYAFLRTNRKSNVGSLGITNGDPPQRINIVGYSDNIEDGRRMLSLSTEIIKIDASRLGSKDNPFGSGNSGAPWLDVSTVYSVSSYYKDDQRSIMWGPRLRGQTTELVNFVANGCR